MKRLFYWSVSQPGNKLPPDALVLEKSIKEGPLYVGRLCDRDGVGKVTTSKQGISRNYFDGVIVRKSRLKRLQFHSRGFRSE